MEARSSGSKGACKKGKRPLVASGSPGVHWWLTCEVRAGGGKTGSRAALPPRSPPNLTPSLTALTLTVT